MAKKIQTWETEVNMELTMIDQTKIEKLFDKRLNLIFENDKAKLEYWKKIVQIDEQIKKARKGKTIKRKLKK